MVDAMFFNFERYDFGSVGRYRMNQRLGVDRENNEQNRVLQWSWAVPVSFLELIKISSNFKPLFKFIEPLSNFSSYHYYILSYV